MPEIPLHPSPNRIERFDSIRGSLSGISGKGIAGSAIPLFPSNPRDKGCKGGKKGKKERKERNSSKVTYAFAHKENKSKALLLFLAG